MIELGPDLFELLNAHQKVGNQSPVVYGAPGLSPGAIVLIEGELGFGIPEDFAYLFAHLQDPGQVFFPWARFQKSDYDRSIAWVLSGVEFDVESNGLWLERWGEKPGALPAALEIVRNDFATWPKLLPLYGHRFLAAEPLRSGNPVFSIMQTDIIYYGANLPHYLLNEFVDREHAHHTQDQPIQRIGVWSDFAEG